MGTRFDPHRRLRPIWRGVCCAAALLLALRIGGPALAALGTWTSTASMSAARYAPTATTLTSGTVLKPKQIGVAREHQVVGAVAGPNVMRRVNRGGIFPTMGFHVAIGVGKNAGIVVLNRWAVKKPAGTAHEHYERGIANAKRRSIHKAVDAACVHVGQIRRLLEHPESATIGIVLRRIFPIEISIERVIAQARQVLAADRNRVTIGRTFVDLRPMQIIRK